jgi:hypothetical protein
MTRSLVVALVLVLSGGVARAQDVVDVERADLATDAGVVSVVGGCWLSTGRCLELAREREQLKAENAKLKTSPTPTAPELIVTIAVGVLVGVGVAIFAPSLVSKLTGK